MRLAPRQRFRVDREGLEQVCVAWWTSEHPRGPAWAGVPEPTKREVVENLKLLLKRQHAQTPGDVAALVAAEGQTLASANRAAKQRARRAKLADGSTRSLLGLLSMARGNGFVTLIGGEPVPGKVPDQDWYWSDAELKTELATREHVPRTKEARALRQARAKEARAGRSRPPRR